MDVEHLCAERRKSKRPVCRTKVNLRLVKVVVTQNQVVMAVTIQISDARAAEFECGSALFNAGLLCNFTKRELEGGGSPDEGQGKKKEKSKHLVHRIVDEGVVAAGGTLRTGFLQLWRAGQDAFPERFMCSFERS